MALANFFDKAALAAAQLLHGFDRPAFEGVLHDKVVGLAFDDTAATHTEGRVTLELATNLLSRFYPRFAVLASGRTARQFRVRLVEVARGINPDIEFVEKAMPLSAVICVGEKPSPVRTRVIHVGSCGWLVHLSSHTPVGCGETSNPFGAAAAACFGLANLFRLLFSEQLPQGGTLDETRSLSLVDFEADGGALENPPLTQVDLGDTSLVGAGAVGNAALWALNLTPRLSGRLAVIDHESVDLSNLQRYVLTTQRDVNTPKVELARRALQQSLVEVHPFRGKWADYLQNREDWHLERVAVAVDSAQDRRLIQGALPKSLFNAWTQPGDLGVSRHEQFGIAACLACLYFPDGERPNEDELIAGALGLPDERKAVRELLYRGTPVGPEWIARIAAAQQIDPASLLSFQGHSLRAFYSEALCGGVMLRLGAGNARPGMGTEVPMAFQSALAGILLASELVLHASGLRRKPLPATSRLDLLRPLGTELSVPVGRHPRCICGDSDYSDAYLRKYPTPKQHKRT